MLDLALMTFFCVKLGRRCKDSGIKSGWHIVRLVGYWIISEILGMMLFLQLGVDLLLAAVCAVVLGCIAGILSYQKSMKEINEQIHGGEPPQLGE